MVKNTEEQKAKALSRWNALNVVTASGNLTRFSTHDSSDCKNHITVVLEKLAQVPIIDQKGCPVPVLVSPPNQKGLESLARKLQLNPEEAGTGWNYFSKPNIPKDRIRGTVVLGTSDRKTISYFAKNCVAKLKADPNINVDTAFIKPVEEQKQKKVGDGYFDVKIYAKIRYNTPTAMAFRKEMGTKYPLSEAEYTGSVQMKKELIEKDHRLKTEQYEIIINGYGDFLAKSGWKKFMKMALEQPNGAALIGEFHRTRPDLNERRIPSGFGHIAYELTRKKPPVFLEPELSDMKTWFEDFEKKYYLYFMEGNGMGFLITHIKEFEGIYDTAKVVLEEKVIKSDLELIQKFRTLPRL